MPPSKGFRKVAAQQSANKVGHITTGKKSAKRKPSKQNVTTERVKATQQPAPDLKAVDSTRTTPKQTAEVSTKPSQATDNIQVINREARGAKIQAAKALEKLRPVPRKKRIEKPNAVAPLARSGQQSQEPGQKPTKKQKELNEAPVVSTLTEKALRELQKAQPQGRTKGGSRAHATSPGLQKNRGQLSGNQDQLLPSVEHHQWAGLDLVGNLAFEESSSESEPDPETAFNNKWGYLPPFDPEIAALIRKIIRKSGMGKSVNRISPSDDAFDDGLIARNVDLKPSKTRDPLHVDFEDLIADIPNESIEERRVFEKLWSFDYEKCLNYSNEALFQRTLMMGLFGRNYLIHGLSDEIPPFDYNVEEIWTCPPMPTTEWIRGEPSLTQPKPDLSIAFTKADILEEWLWRKLPRPLQRLVLYEKPTRTGSARAFPFFSIETKKAYVSAEDLAGTRQNLNCASQSLHNLYVFFNEAGDIHRAAFFSKVRYFSAVATTEGFNIRIHRALECEEKKHIYPGYPLEFVFEELKHISRQDFSRANVLDAVGRILYGQIVRDMRIAIEAAFRDILTFVDTDEAYRKSRSNINFFRYGSALPQSTMTSHGPTPITSTPASERQSGYTTPSASTAVATRRDRGTATPQLRDDANQNNQSFNMSDAPPLSRRNSMSPQSPPSSQPGGSKRRHPDTEQGGRRGDRKNAQARK